MGLLWLWLTMMAILPNERNSPEKEVRRVGEILHSRKSPRENPH
jgi:hypothetical protein